MTLTGRFDNLSGSHHPLIFAKKLCITRQRSSHSFKPFLQLQILVTLRHFKPKVRAFHIRFNFFCLLPLSAKLIFVSINYNYPALNFDGS